MYATVGGIPRSRLLLVNRTNNCGDIDPFSTLSWLRPGITGQPSSKPNSLGSDAGLPPSRETG